VENAFENDWYLAHGTCAGRKTDDMATDDQLFITNHMLDNLETDIDELEAEMGAASADLVTYLDNWKQQVKDLINANMSNFDETTRAALEQFMQNNLD